MAERVVRPVQGEEDEASLKQVLLQCFEFPAERWESWSKTTGRENLRVLEENGRILGGLGALPEGQWFGGRIVPSAAIVAVGIAPEHRTGGAGRDLMTAVLREMRGRGFGLSVLFASTQRLYRAVGYELAGNRMRYRIGTRDLPRGPLEMPVLRLEEDERAPLEAAHARRAARSAGHLRRTGPLWERLLGRDLVYRYALGSREEPEGSLIFAQKKLPSGYGLDVREMIALTPAAARTLWRFLAGHSSLARTLEWDGPAGEPLTFLIPEGDAVPQANERWLVRVLDPVAALEARG